MNRPPDDEFPHEPPQDSPQGTDPDVGSVGEEAAKLFGALADWARDHTPDTAAQPDLGAALGGVASHAARAFTEVNEHLATGSAECRYCPVCRTVHAIRQTSPEVRAHLTQAASSFLQAAAGLLATLPPPGSGHQPPRQDFERIDLDDEPEGGA